MKKVFVIFFLTLIYLSFYAQSKQSVNYNKALSILLDSILINDQTYRLQLDEAHKKFAFDSDEVQSILEVIKNNDDANLIKVKQILDQYGWLGPDVIGKNGSEALFLVIQHSDQSTQEKYLPMLRDAVKKGNAQGSSLALLEDRVAIGQGKKQIYGSQISGYYGKYKFAPIEDEINVNKRRASVGLDPIEEYAKKFGIIYKMEDQNTLTNSNGFWERYSIVLSLVIIVLIFSSILLLLYKFKQFAWFWLLLLFFIFDLIMLPVDYYSDYSVVLHFKGNAILFLFMRNVCYCAIIFIITFSAYKLFKFKHIVLDLVSIFSSVYIYSTLLNNALLRLFLSDSGLIFRFSVFEPCIYSAVFLIISFVLLRISYKKKKKELLENLNEDK